MPSTLTPTLSSASSTIQSPVQVAASAQTPVLDLTVVVPTFNGSERLPDVIDHLRRQQNADLVRWEILVVDNNSSDRTQAVVESLRAGWHQAGWGPQGVSLRYCFEPRQGLAFARQRAIEMARGNWVGFIDDDNWPDENWVAAAQRFIQQTVNRDSQIVAFGSCLQARYETRPTPDFRHLAAFLAIRDHGRDLYPFNPEQLQLPAGAGLVVNRRAWLEAVPACLPGESKLRKRGEDYAALLYLHQKGGKIAYNPAMKVQHWIPSQRIKGDYLLKLAYNTGLVTYSLRSVGAGRFQRTKIALRTFGGGLKRFWNAWRDRNSASLQASQSSPATSSPAASHATNSSKASESTASEIINLWAHSPGRKIITDFQLLFHLGSALSPFYAIFPALMSGIDCRRLMRWIGSDSMEQSF